MRKTGRSVCGTDSPLHKPAIFSQAERMLGVLKVTAESLTMSADRAAFGPVGMKPGPVRFYWSGKILCRDDSLKLAEVDQWNCT